jgi:hypothetical protein
MQRWRSATIYACRRFRESAPIDDPFRPPIVRAPTIAVAAVAEHVVGGAGELAPLVESSEGVGGAVRERDEPCLPALSRSVDAGAERAVHHESSEVEVDVLPAQSEQFTEPQPGVRGDPVEVGVLAVLAAPCSELLFADPVGSSGAVGAELRGARERLNLVGLEAIGDVSVARTGSWMTRARQPSPRGEPRDPRPTRKRHPSRSGVAASPATNATVVPEGVTGCRLRDVAAVVRRTVLVGGGLREFAAALVWVTGAAGGVALGAATW